MRTVFHNSIIRAGNAIVLIDLKKKFCVKILDPSFYKSVKLYFKFYKKQPQEIKKYLPKPISLFKNGNIYFYVERLIEGVKYVPTWENVFTMMKKVKDIILSLSDEKGKGYINGNLTYGNIILTKNGIKIIDWIFLKKSYPLIDFLNFSESCYFYIFRDRKISNRSLKFIEYVIYLVNRYSEELNLDKTHIKEIINEFLRSKSLYPSFQFRKILKNKMRL